MESALTSVATGTLTIARARAARGNTIALLPTINLSSTVPVRSMRLWRTEFSDYSWGRTTRSYFKMADALPDAEFETLIEDAREYAEQLLLASGAFSGLLMLRTRMRIRVHALSITPSRMKNLRTHVHASSTTPIRMKSLRIHAPILSITPPTRTKSVSHLSRPFL